MSSTKIIRSSADLAINGAEPAFSEALHVGRPNIGNRSQFYLLMDEMFDRRWLSNNGKLVQEFEAALAAHLGVRHCLTMCNGTIAMEVAIQALGLKGEVIVPSYTFIATAHALHWLGITPVFADIDPVSHNIDPESVRRLITAKTTGIIGVHLWGRPAAVEALQAIASENDLNLVFDAAHAFSCDHAGSMIGSFGNCEIFSFHATKFFNTFEGGAIATNDDNLADRARRMRNFGFAGVDNVEDNGTNGKMMEPAAAMGLVNLQEVDRIISINRQNHLAYRQRLSGLPGLSVITFDETERSNYQYLVVEVGAEFGVDRDRIVGALQAENVLARRYFWPGCHRAEPYRTLYPNADAHLGNTQIVADRVIVLPTGLAVDDDKIDIIGSVFEALRR